MPNQRPRNSRDDKSKNGKSPKTSFNDRKGSFKSSSNESFRRDQDTDKKSFDRDDKRPIRSSGRDTADYKPKRSFGKPEFGDKPKRFESKGSKEAGDWKPRKTFGKPEFGDKPKKFEGKSFGTAGKRPFKSKEESEFGDDNRFSRPQREERKSFDRGDKKTLSPRKSNTDRLGGKGPKRPSAPVHNDGLIRLNRYISNAGICSRRKADELIAAGVVSVNGEVVSELGFRVDPAKDVIRYNGETLKREKRVYVR